MFDYLDNDENSSRKLVLDTPPPLAGRLVRYVPYSTSIVVDLPDTTNQLRARHSAKFWSKLRKQERKFEELYGPLHFEVVTAPERLGFWLPQAREIFAQRWRDEYTSIPWKSARGFQPYHEAMVTLARRGHAALAVLHANDELLSFRYCLAWSDWYYCYQQATTPDDRYRPYSLGKQNLVKLLTYLINETDYRHLDLMLGDTAHKREWESWRRSVYLRLEAPDSGAGRIQLAWLTACGRAKLHVQFSNPKLRAAAKSLLLPAQRAANTIRERTSFRHRHT